MTIRAPRTAGWDAQFPRSQFGFFPAGDESHILAALSKATGTPIDENASTEANLRELIASAYERSLIEVLRRLKVLYPSYKMLWPYEANLGYPTGPLLPIEPPSNTDFSFLGRRIGLPIGIASSPLTANSLWIDYFSKLGFNVLTYRTMRPRYREHYDPPLWIVEQAGQRSLRVADDAVTLTDSEDDLSVNSIGVPSPDPDDWQPDVAKSIERLPNHQVLIVSVMGDWEELQDDIRSLAADFALVAGYAADAGSEFIELNLSCPNSRAPGSSSVMKDLLCLDERKTAAVVDAVRNVVPDHVNLIAKFSAISYDRLKEVIKPISSHISAVSGINTVAARIEKEDGEPAFNDRERAGVSGGAIFEQAMEFVESAMRAKEELGASWDVIGMGGVSTPSKFKALYDMGADCVQTAAGAYTNPLLAWDCLDEISGEVSSFSGVLMSNSPEYAERRVLEFVIENPSTTTPQVLLSIPGSSQANFDALRSLESKGRVTSEKKRHSPLRWQATT